ncbi:MULTISPECIES: PLP-dependent aminotransferase family protein [unclassified Leucobacter]|uniref:MocR-like transcription factor YczR n=1 Tax=unclassified Leucobacter TaxID=2621730 RepID=UPI00165DCBEF|nr:MULTISPECIES: PLP-dependent aminotransferase family protein [unclassified Leucobacter]MBC9926021.1 PLP-dependent aminotransferase family protein [Leucobacter sp. cx-169]
MIAQRLTARGLARHLGNWRGGGLAYAELAESISLLVRDGRILAGTALPAERPLAEELGVSRTTVAASYHQLRETGTAQSRRGSGTVIRRARVGEAEPWAEGSVSGIDLTRASPPPWAGLAELGARALTEHSDAFTSSGYDTVGHPALRAAIADRYTRRGLPTSAEQIMVTLGAQHAIFLIARTLLGRGDRSLIESPSYPHAREALVAAGALVAELPVGADGYDAASILEIAKRTSPRLAYLIPDHHNPTGLSMPQELRASLIAMLTAQGTAVIADETTAELTLGDPRLVTPFAASAEHAHQRDLILTVGSLGKTVWGGLRVGWIRAAPDLLARLEASRRVSDLGTGTWEQVLARLALEQYDEILAIRTRQLTAGHRALADGVAQLLPGWRLSAARGGVGVWADLGEPSSSRLCRESERRGVQLVPGPRFGSPGVFERYVRLPFTAPAAELARAVPLLREAWADRGQGIDVATRRATII